MNMLQKYQLQIKESRPQQKFISLPDFFFLCSEKITFYLNTQSF